MRIAVTLGLIVLVAGGVVAASFRGSGRVWTPSELLAKDPRGAVEVRGVVLRGRRLHISDRAGGPAVPVRIAGPVPDALGPGRVITLTGAYRGGVLVAQGSTVRSSCAQDHC